MTLPVQTPINSYVYAGSPNFDYGFLILDAGDLLVTVDGITKVSGADYTVSGAGNVAGGSITYIGSLTIGQKVTLVRQVALTRLSDYQEEGDFLAGDFNADFDRLWMATQDTNSLFATRGIRAPAGDVLQDLPSVDMRKGLLLGFDAVTGQPIVAGPTTGTATALALSLASTSPGAGLVGRSPSVAYPVGTVGAEFTGIINAAALSGVDRSGVADSTAAITSALAICKRIYFPAGTYLLANVSLPSNVEIYGDGDATILRPLTSATAYVFVVDSGSSNPANNLQDIYLHDLQLRGWSDTAGLLQFYHLVTINGITKFKAERVTFRAPRGDCLYVGSGNAGGQERHNYDVSLRKCHFDGVNHSNRNGISFIDCEGGNVEDCLFENLTDPTMPGAIDIEPNSSWNVCRDIKVSRNRFKKTGGAAGWFAIQVGNIGMTTPISGFLVEGNTIDSAGYTTDLEKGLFISLYGDADSTRYPLDCKVADNTFRNISYPWRIDGVSDATFKDNRYLGTLAEARIGATYKCLDVAIEDDYFYQVANDNTSGGNGLTVFNGSFITLRRNRFVNCGKANGTQGYCIHFSTGTSDDVYVEDNVASGANTTHFIQAAGTHTFTSATNFWGVNEIGALPFRDFPAAVGTTTYDPPSLTSGSGTSVTVSAPGARFGRQAHCAFSIDQALVTFIPHVSAADQITVVLTNRSAGTVDLASGTLTVWAPPV